MSWVQRAERALEGGPVAEGDVLLRGARPPLLDAEGYRAVAAPLLAAVVWSAAIFRETVTETSIDPIALGLRIVALGLTLRVLLLSVQLFGRVRRWIAAPRHALVLTPEGLLYRTPTLDRAVAREQVVGVVQHGQGQARQKRATAPVYLVTDPASGPSHVVLPPFFDGGAGRLAERLMRWRGGWDEPEGAEHPEPDANFTKLYDDAAAGRVMPGVTAVRQGREWLKDGPYALVLIAITGIEGLLRAGPQVWQAIDPAVGGGMVLVLVAVVLRWLWMQRREIAPQKGLSLVMTPAELLLRPASGMIRIRWSDLVSVTIVSKRAWSVLEGAHEARQLVLSRRGASPVRYDEPYLGAPAEVIQVLVEAYRVGRLPAH